MKKRDLTKLALMGLTSGCLLSQAPAEAFQIAAGGINSGIMIAKSCGAGCGGSKPAQPSTQPSTQSSSGQVADNSDYNRPQSSCGGSRQTASCAGRTTPSQSSCNGARPNGSCSSKANPPQSSCNGARPNGSCSSKANPPQSSCGGSSQTASCSSRSSRSSSGSQNPQSSCGGSSQTASCSGRTNPPQSSCRGSSNDGYTAYNDAQTKRYNSQTAGADVVPVDPRDLTNTNPQDDKKLIDPSNPQVKIK